MLTDFYQAGDVINAARSPGSFEGEGDTRQKGAWETEQDTRTLNAYFATTERVVDKREFFAQLHARRYRFVAYFGSDDARAYDDLHKIYAEIVVSVRMLVQTYQERNFGTLPQNRREWQAVIWDKGDDDPIRARLDRVIDRIEATCGQLFARWRNETALVIPAGLRAIVPTLASAGDERAFARSLEFFAANIRNPYTRRPPI